MRFALVQCALVPPPALVKRERRRSESEEQEQVVQGQRLGLEDRLHEGYINEPQLRQERGCHGKNEHPVLRQAAAEPAILDG